MDYYVNEHDIYVPSELVGQGLNNGAKTYYCYMLELDRSFSYDITMDHLILATSSELNFDEDVSFELEVDRGCLTVQVKYAGAINLTSEEVIYLIVIGLITCNKKKQLTFFFETQLFCC